MKILKTFKNPLCIWCCIIMLCYFVYSSRCLTDSLNPLHTESTVFNYTCPTNESYRVSNYYHNVSAFDCCSKHGKLCSTYNNGSFSQVATLMFATGEDAVKHLFSRQTQKEFTFGSLFAVLVVYFFLSCWCAGTFIASGLVVPML
jgi:chloride channel 7